ncbi:catechol-2,3-dioxygenase [Kribbella orskensis]|uniref:Catechol-2,3-dioxygenase n=1 Tax=Kribbella orskensis TaxID=2512216 RepID=A0ABY2BJJ8_9ACTN|nr:MULTISPECIES: VOC family protein [Kribbella]TCN38397.1 catechol-2,3-dioxygenase [Kribbella sp. VKM Ac-2500]TCO20073.1 catechol-2,3-dioxygenase [Kribbella orskensis]
MPASLSPGLHRVEIGCRDLDRSLDFYQGLLGFQPLPDAPRPADRSRLLSRGTVVLELVEVGAAGNQGGWVNDDLQGGIRHLGMKVAGVDRQLRRLEDAGVTVLSQPLDVLGDVRIAFFLDPDGARLEFIQGNLAYQRISSPELAAAEAAQVADEEPRFDHVAVTVSDLPAALTFWRDRFGFEVIGDIRHHGDPRGFLMTYLQAGQAVLEVFSFDQPIVPNNLAAAGSAVLGPRRLFVDAPGEQQLVAPDGVPVTLGGSR